MTISERIEPVRRERRVLTRVSRAAWRLWSRLNGNGRGRWSGPRRGISIRTLATAAGLSPSPVHQIVADADPDALDAALGELRAAGWPAPEHPDSGEDTELCGRDNIADRACSSRRQAVPPAERWQGQPSASSTATLRASISFTQRSPRHR